MKLIVVLGAVMAVPVLFALVDPGEGAAAPRPTVVVATGAERVWPVSGRVTSGFGYRLSPDRPGGEYHSGIDIAANTGTSVGTAAAGMVTFAGTADNYGNLIIIQHRDAYGAYETWYGHLSSIEVDRGQIVQAAQIIGLIGSTGRSTGPHLHFEYRVGGRPLDPYHLYR